MNMNNLKIGTRLMLGFGLVLALLVLIVSTSFVRMVQTQSGMEAATEYERRAGLADAWLNKSLLNANLTIAIAKAAGLPEVKAHYGPLIKETSAEIAEVQKQLEAAVSTDKGKALLAVIAEKRKDYNESRDKMYEFFKSSDQPAVEALLKEKLLPQTTAYIAALGDLKKHEDELAGQRADEVRADMRMAKTLIVVLMAVSLAVGIGGAIAITRSVTRPLQDAVGAARIIADNDLSHT